MSIMKRKVVSMVGSLKNVKFKKVVAENNREDIGQENVVRFLHSVEGLHKISDYKFREEPIFPLLGFSNDPRLLVCKQRRWDF